MMNPIEVLKVICDLMNEYVGILVGVDCETREYGNYDICAYMIHNDKKYVMPTFMSSGNDILNVMKLISEIRDEMCQCTKFGYERYAVFSGVHSDDYEFTKRILSPQTKVISDSIDRFLVNSADFSEDELRIRLDMLGRIGNDQPN